MGKRRGDGLLEARMTPVELRHLAERPPPQIATAGRAKVSIGDGRVAAVVMEARRQLVADRLDVDEALLPREADGLFVESLGLELLPFEPRDLRGDGSRAASEVFRAVLGPARELGMVLADRVQAVSRSRTRERRIEVVLGQLEALRDRPDQLACPGRRRERIGDFARVKSRLELGDEVPGRLLGNAALFARVPLEAAFLFRFSLEDPELRRQTAQRTDERELDVDVIGAGVELRAPGEAGSP